MMKHLYTLALLLAFLFISARTQAQKVGTHTYAPAGKTAEVVYNPLLEPFYHGVASGDPLTDAVIIWTRITSDEPSVEVTWKIATDTSLEAVVDSGSVITGPDLDYTVKVDVDGLESNTTYYYMFSYGAKNSLIGRTRTAPAADEADHLKFVVVSCQSYEHGYFNAYGRIADRNDIDAVVHLGDYIYEYETGIYGDSALTAGGRAHDTVETVELAQYRARYSQYRLDPDLMRAHQQQAFINIWDDHESANDAYTDGAENHTDSTEGDWEVRKSMARKAFFEWLPIRDLGDSTIIRTIAYGDMADIILIDTRLEGREEQINDITNLALYSPTRTLLGMEQRAWFMNELKTSQAKWKVIANQVIFSEFNVGWAADTSLGQTYESTESIFLDIWDGYPVERDILIEYMDTANIENAIWLTGDFHSAFAFDVAKRPSVFGYDQALPTYDAATGTGSVAVEFATPSISSANFDENVGPALAAAFEFQINNPLPIDPPVNPNPHMKFTDLDRHGYFLLDLKPDTAQANYYFVESILTPTENESYGAGLYTMCDSNHLEMAASESAPKMVQQAPAPDLPLGVITASSPENFAKVFSVSPNPTASLFTVSFGLNQASSVRFELVNTAGQVEEVLFEGKLPEGHHTQNFLPTQAESGMYMLRLVTAQGVTTHRLVLN